MAQARVGEFVIGPPLRGFHHSAWKPSDGAPVDIWSIVQAQDGELWLGTGAGLYRFDGVQFRRHPMPLGTRLASNNITALHFDAEGALWIGYHGAGISRLDARGIRHFASGTDLPRGMVLDFSDIKRVVSGERVGTLISSPNKGAA